jgi:hypothetical protein
MGGLSSSWPGNMRLLGPALEIRGDGGRIRIGPGGGEGGTCCEGRVVGCGVSAAASASSEGDRPLAEFLLRRGRLTGGLSRTPRAKMLRPAAVESDAGRNAGWPVILGLRFTFGHFGGRTRARALDPLIKSRFRGADKFRRFRTRRRLGKPYLSCVFAHCPVVSRTRGNRARRTYFVTPGSSG